MSLLDGKSLEKPRDFFFVPQLRALLFNFVFFLK